MISFPYVLKNYARMSIFLKNFQYIFFQMKMSTVIIILYKYKG